MSSTRLLQHQIEKFGVVTVMDVLLLDTQNNEPLMYLDTLKMTSINQEGEQKEIRGGIGAPELISYDFARTITLEIQDALASMSSLQMLWGGEKIDKDYNYTAIFETEVTEDGKIDLPEGMVLTNAYTTPVADDKVWEGTAVLDLKSDTRYPATGFVAEDGTGEELVKAHITAPGATKGSVVKVFLPDGAVASTDEGAVALAINSIDLPPTVKMVGQTFFIEQSTGKHLPMQIEIPLLKINIGGGLTMEAEGDAAVFDFNAKALADPITKNFFVLKQLGKAK